MDAGPYKTTGIDEGELAGHSPIIILIKGGPRPIRAAPPRRGGGVPLISIIRGPLGPEHPPRSGPWPLSGTVSETGGERRRDGCFFPSSVCRGPACAPGWTQGPPGTVAGALRPLRRPGYQIEGNNSHLSESDRCESFLRLQMCHAIVEPSRGLVNS